MVGIIVLCLLAGVYLAAWKRSSKAAPSPKITKHTVETPAEDALKYWSADKMRSAQPTPLPNVTALKRGKRPRRRSSRASRPQGLDEGER
jgi:hypothetical protein